MNIGLALPSIYAVKKYFPDRIFAPLPLFEDLALNLAKKNHSVTTFVPMEDDFVNEFLNPDNELLRYTKFHNRTSPEELELLTSEVRKHSVENSVLIRAFAALKNHQIDVLHIYHDTVQFTGHFLTELFDSRKIIFTLHDPLPSKAGIEHFLFQRFMGHQYLSISNAQRAASLNLHFIETIYHGIAPEQYIFEKNPEDYLLFIGRLVPEKGLHTALTVALESNTKLEVATNFPDAAHESDYYLRQIKPFLKHPLVHESGVISGKKKEVLLRSARALLFPIEWEEPFGMVMIEAMASGTPVIAYNRGSVAEIVVDGVTGFIVEPAESVNSSKSQISKKGIAGLIEAVARIGEIDRAACRAHVQNHFSLDQMVDGHEKVYEQVIREK